MKLKKPVFRMFLKLRLSVHCIVTNLQADSGAGDQKFEQMLLIEMLSNLEVKIYYSLVFSDLGHFNLLSCYYNVTKLLRNPHTTQENTFNTYIIFH